MSSGGSLASGDVFALSHAFVDAMARLQPIAATYRGVPGYDDKWDDFRPEGVAEVRAELASFRERALSIEVPADPWHRLAARVMLEAIELEMSSIDEADPLDDLNSIASPFQAIRMVFDGMDTSTKEGWDNILGRLSTIEKPMDGLREKLSAHLRSASKPGCSSRRQAEAVMKQARIQAGEESFFLTLPRAAVASGLCGEGFVEQLSGAAERARFVFHAMAEFLERDYLPSAVPGDGAGRERWQRHAQRFLGIDVDPLETYAWGFEEIRSIGEAMEKAAEEILPGAPLAEVMQVLKSDPTRCAASPEEFIRLMQERQMRALSELSGEHFDIPEPVRRIDVRVAPPTGILGAYYTVPSEDFSRPGIVWYSRGEQPGLIPLFDEISTAYHEGFPGHHLQCATQISLSDRLSRFHRLADGYSGYAEGWALYAERLMHELGYLDKPDYVLGMLCAQMMRACRIVVDIGSHLQLPIPKDSPLSRFGETAWSFDLGIRVIEELGQLGPAHAKSEMTRYLGWPGQAISYKVGEREILSLRKQEEARLLGAFRLKDFHRMILGSGNVSLALLADLVRGGGVLSA